LPGGDAGGVGGGAASGVRLQPLLVRTAAAEVGAFAAALGLPATCGPAPLTFPIRWLGQPELRREIVQRFGARHGVLVHQSQSFVFGGVLGIERDYRLEAVVRSDAGRVILTAAVRERTNEILRMETVLRVAESAPAAASGRRAPPLGETPIPELRLGPIGLGQTRRYAAAALDDNPVHTDIAAARAAGLSDVIVPGMFIAGQFERALLGWRRDLSIHRLHAMFLQPLPVGGGIVVGSRIVRSARQGDCEQMVVRLIVRSDRDEPLCVGEVEALAPAASASPLPAR